MLSYVLTAVLAGAGLVASGPLSYVLTSVLAGAGLVASAPLCVGCPVVVYPRAPCVDGPVINYTIVAGNTLGIIAANHSTGICNIAYLNNITNPDFILAGQTILVPTLSCNIDNTTCIKDTTPTATCVTDPSLNPHTVLAGETFYVISQNLGITLESLEAANPGILPEALQIGYNLTVPVC